MTQLTKLGDVAKYLREGDELLWQGIRLTVTDAAGVRVEAAMSGGGNAALAHREQVELVNPRWITPDERARMSENITDHDVVRSSNGLGAAGEVPLGGRDVYWLIRTVNGKPEPVRAECETYPRETTGHTLRRGDLVSIGRRDVGTHLVLGIDHGTEYPVVLWHVRDRRVTGNCLETSVVLFSRGCAIPKEAESGAIWSASDNKAATSSTNDAATPYREATRADVRAGMRVAVRHEGEWVGPLQVTRVDQGVIQGRSKDVNYLYQCKGEWGAEPARIYAEPCPICLSPDCRSCAKPAKLDVDSLRAAWEFWADRTPWPTIARTLLTRAGVVDGDEAAKQGAYFRAEATKLVESLSQNQRHARHQSWSLLVVLTENPDRPVELYSEALNGAAYRAKVEELWPTPVVKVEARKSCVNCGAMCGGSVNKCGDCLMAMDKLASERTGIRAAMHSSEKRFRGLADQPSTHLNAGALYHAKDDCDVFGVPGGHN